MRNIAAGYQGFMLIQQLWTSKEFRLRFTFREVAQLLQVVRRQREYVFVYSVRNLAEFFQELPL